MHEDDVEEIDDELKKDYNQIASSLTIVKFLNWPNPVLPMFELISGVEKAMYWSIWGLEIFVYYAEAWIDERNYYFLCPKWIYFQFWKAECFEYKIIKFWRKFNIESIQLLIKQMNEVIKKKNECSKFDMKPRMRRNWKDKSRLTNEKYQVADLMYYQDPEIYFPGETIPIASISETKVETFKNKFYVDDDISEISDPNLESIEVNELKTDDTVDRFLIHSGP
jgi:hypothetical protein